MRYFGPLSLTFPLPPLFQTPSYGPDCTIYIFAFVDKQTDQNLILE